MPDSPKRIERELTEAARIYKAMDLADQWINEGKYLILTVDQIIELALKEIDKPKVYKV